MRFWRNVAHLIEEADVIVEIVDARMPFLARNLKLIDMINKAGKKHLLVFNKSDLISSKFKQGILRDFGEEIFFASAKEGNGMARFRTYLKILARKSDFEKLRVGFVGYPNVGKSAIINALVRRSKTKVAGKAGTTRGVHWVSFSNIKILDSPGVIPNHEWDEVKLGIVGAKDANKIKDPERVALAIIDLFMKGDFSNIAKTYQLKEEDFNDKKDYEILEAIGKKKNLLSKGGIVDEKRTCMMLIKDWQSGKLNLND